MTKKDKQIMRELAMKSKIKRARKTTKHKHRDRGGKFISSRVKQDIEQNAGLEHTDLNISIQPSLLKKARARTKLFFEQFPTHRSSKMDYKDYRGVCRYMRYCLGLTCNGIAEGLGISRRTVIKWVKRKTIKAKRRIIIRKITPEIESFIVDYAQYRWSVVDKASLSYIKQLVWNNFAVQLSLSTIQKVMHKHFGFSLSGKSTFLLTDTNKKKRVEFCEHVINTNIKGEQILFTDEKIFTLHKYSNKKSNRLWVPKAAKRHYIYGEDKFGIFDLLKQETPKYDKQIMVAGGISNYGVTELIFCIGTIDTSAYLRALDVFNEHRMKVRMNHGAKLIFQQDGASCHTSKVSYDKINKLFGNETLAGRWPANSPDLSPIELLWKELEKQLRLKQYNTLDDLKIELQRIWNRIPVDLCQRLIKTFDSRVRWVKDQNGSQYAHYAKNMLDPNEKIIKQLRVKPEPPKFDTPWNEDDNIKHILINDKQLDLLRQKYIKTLDKCALAEIKKYYAKYGTDINQIVFDSYKAKYIMPIICKNASIQIMSLNEFYQYVIPTGTKISAINLKPIVKAKNIFEDLGSIKIGSTASTNYDENPDNNDDGSIDDMVARFSLSEFLSEKFDKDVELKAEAMFVELNKQVFRSLIVKPKSKPSTNVVKKAAEPKPPKIQKVRKNKPMTANQKKEHFKNFSFELWEAQQEVNKLKESKGEDLIQSINKSKLEKSINRSGSTITNLKNKLESKLYNRL